VTSVAGAQNAAQPVRYMFDTGSSCRHVPRHVIMKSAGPERFPTKLQSVDNTLNVTG
jgi:hypothetical protein